MIRYKKFQDFVPRLHREALQYQERHLTGKNVSVMSPVSAIGRSTQKMYGDSLTPYLQFKTLFENNLATLEIAHNRQFILPLCFTYLIISILQGFADI